MAAAESASEVLRAGLRLLEGREAKLAALRAALEEGKRSGVLGHMINDHVCRSDAELRAWMSRCRLNPGSHVAAAQADSKDPRFQSATERMRENGEVAVRKLRRFAQQLG